jgi:CYTH domain-containing protein/predicted ATPase
MSYEIERRFLVSSLDTKAELGQAVSIIQGYFEIPFPEHSLRVRIMDGKEAVVTQKLGSGIRRREIEHPIALDTANLLLESCVHIIEKDRYFCQGWSIDFFHYPLKGLVLAEKEISSVFEKVDLPEWMKRATEVTDSLSNLHLARLATDLKGVSTEPLTQIYQMLSGKIPRIVLTGGPCSGKSSIMESLKSVVGRRVHCVPETAAIIISQVGIKPVPGDPLAVQRFNRTIYRIQKIFEATSAEYAISQGKQALVLDRGSVDNAAYMSGGLEEMENIYKTSRQSEYAQYDLVVCLEVPPFDVYERMKSNNPARSENYEQAKKLGDRIKEVWMGHPNFCIISGESGWKEKEEAAMKVIARFISGKNKTVS